MQSANLPGLNASLNAASAVLLLTGFVAIRKRYVRVHMTCMLSALALSILFLCSYLYYHVVVRGGQPTRFASEGGIRVAYFTILGTHTVLAMVTAPMALFTAYLAMTGKFHRHLRVARWTLPIWLYVSVTGVIVYWMLYRLYPSTSASLG
jgi:uncharacterized membrane protein YozB (DUF420 family)